MDSKTKVATICVIIDEQKQRLLLAMKKRGFGAGWWNGPGGKPDNGETLEQAAIRETQEEIGIKITKIEEIGTLHFDEPGEGVSHFEVHLFRAYSWEGKPQETEEMKPRWFPYSAIPYSKMWPDDPHWLPLVIEGKKIQGNFRFNDQRKLISHDVRIVS